MCEEKDVSYTMLGTMESPRPKTSCPFTASKIIFQTTSRPEKKFLFSHSRDNISRE